MSRPTVWFRHLFLPVLGFLLLLGSLLYGAWLGNFPPWLLGMGLCAAAIIVLGVLWQERGSLRDSIASMTYAFFVTLSAVFVYLLVANHSERLDLTRYKIHTLSDQTIALLAGLETPVRVVAFAEPSQRQGYRELFDLYEEHGDMVTFEIYDPNVDIGAARQFNENVFAGYVYAISKNKAGEERRHRARFTPDDQRRESKLSNALLRSERGGEQRIYFTTGHNERALTVHDEMREQEAMRSLRYFAQVIQQNVMPIAELNISAENRIPEDAALVIVASPTVDLLAMEREVLLEYLNEGGALLVMIEPEFGQGELTDLAALLRHAGVASPNTVLVDQFAPQFLDVISAPVFDHPVTREVPNGIILTNQTRALEISPELSEASGLAVYPLLVSNKTVWPRNPREIFSRRDQAPPEDKSAIKSYTLATASSFPTPGGPRGSAARVIAFGDADMISDALIPQGPAAYLALNSVNWLVAREDLLAIPPKLIPTTSFQLPANRLYVILGILLLVDLVLLAGGVGYTVARRRMG